MPGLHHIGYWVEDLGSACTQWTVGLGVGPFEMIEHVPFDSFELNVDGRRERDIAFDHSAAFAAWGPIVVELGQVHAIDDRLAQAYGFTVGAISHVSWIVDDLAAESGRLEELGCPLINTAQSGPVSVAWHHGGPLFPHPIELHGPSDAIIHMYERLTVPRTSASRGGTAR